MLHVPAGVSSDPVHDGDPHISPRRTVQALVLIAGRHSWHSFDGFRVPDAMHAPPITHPVVAGFMHASADSSQKSAVHESMSPQPRGLPEHAPAPLQVSPVVQNCPSLHDAPAAVVDHAVCVMLGSHSRHAFIGLVLPAARHTPPITHPLEIGLSQRSPPSLQLSEVHASPSSQSRAVPRQPPIP